MAIIYALDYGTKPQHVGNYGNGWNEDFTVTATPAAADKVVLGIIPAGIRVTGIRLQNGAGGANAAVTLGYEPEDKGGPVAAPTAFLPSTAVATAGAVVASFDPITFDSPVRLVATVGAAAFGAATKLVAIVSGKVVGVR